MKCRNFSAALRILTAAFLTVGSFSLSVSGFATQNPAGLEFSLTDSEGKTHSQREWQQSQAVVLLFVGAECPISNAFAPEINRISAAYGSKRVSFYLVHSDPDITTETAANHAAEYGYKFTVLLDPKQVLAKKFGVTITPTAVLLSNEGEPLYRGRIDNRYIALGQKRPEATQHDLRDALDATLAGKKVAEAVTKPIGCFIPSAGK
jgi:peroxiredoxin